MIASATNLLKFIEGKKQFIIPIYQRTYSWQLSQCNKLFSDILKVSKDNGFTPSHFIGSIVYFQDNQYTQSQVPKLLVIDGQQRITTISLLISALAEFLKKNAEQIVINEVRHLKVTKDDGSEIILQTHLGKLQNSYLFNADEDGESNYKLILTRKDKETYLKILKEAPWSEKESVRITENINFFKSQITKDNVKAVFNGLQRLYIVEVALEKEKDNPQLIFESLNSTGLDLSQADLIRNYVLMGLPIDLQAKLYENYWYQMEQNYGNEYTRWFDSFMRDYLTVKTGYIPKIGFVYEAFKKYSQDYLSTSTIEHLVQDVYRFSGFYANIVLHKEPNEDIKKCFKSLSALTVNVAYPFILAVYSDYDEGKVSKEDFVSILNLIESYVFRRAICGIPTNSLNKTFGNLYKTVKHDNYLESVQAEFQLMGGYKRFPDDVEFKNSLISKDVYNFYSKGYMFDKIENWERKEPVKIDEYTIEHIMPQNPNLIAEWQDMLGANWQAIQKKYLHTIGNLTLTGYNSSLSDRSFKEKKTMAGGFNDSPIRLNENVRNKEVWNEASINSRAEDIAHKSLTIWEAPKLSDEILNQYRKVVEKEVQEYTIDNFVYLKGDMLELFNAFQKRVLNIGDDVKVEFKKLYIAFKSSTNFVDIEPQKARLRMTLNVDIEDVQDSKSICRDIKGLGKWGNGNVEVSLSNLNELDDVMEIVMQSYNLQMVS